MTVAVPNLIGRSGGSPAWRNNNPGNMVAGDFARANGAIGSDGRFAIFPTEQKGTDALLALLGTAKYQALTVEGAIYKWSPPIENNSAAYAVTVAKRLGVPLSTPMRTLTTVQLVRMGLEIRRYEGWQVGTQHATTLKAAPPDRTTADPLAGSTKAAGTPADPGDVIDTRASTPTLGGTPDPLAFLSIGSIGNLDQLVLSADVSLSTTQVSQIVVVLVDNGGKLAQTVTVGTLARLGKWQFRVSALEEFVDRTATPRLTLTLRADLVQQLNRDRGPVAQQNSTPGRMINGKVRECLVEPSVSLWPNIDVRAAKTGIDNESSAAKAESWWEATGRWAKSEGRWRFEADNALFYGSPSFFAQRLPSMRIDWRGAPEGVVLQKPSFRLTEDGADNDVVTTTMTVSVHRTAGVKLRPGMTVQTVGNGIRNGVWIITDVSGSLRSVAPWAVTAVSIEDPKPAPDADDQVGTQTGTQVASADRATVGDGMGMQRASKPVATNPNLPKHVQIALGENGTREGKQQNANPYSAAMGNPPEPWCQDFVNWCLTQAGISFPPGARVPGTIEALAAWRRAKRGVSMGSLQPGDVVYKSRATANGMRGHVGIVVAVNGGNLITIEGNSGGSSDRVFIRQSHPKSVWNLGAFRP